jgi:acetoin utilization deacetylase AcuC-like enzyme
MNEVDYSKLRNDVLEKMIYQRGIECKMKKDEMVKMLKLHDEGKYIEPMKDTVYEKSENGYNVGIDIKNQKDISQISKLMEKKEAKSLNRFSDERVWYWSPQKLI